MLELNTLSNILFILAVGVFLLQIFMVAGWIAAVHRGAEGSVPFWPLMLSIILTIAAFLTR